MILVIDNYDSFTFNLVQALQTLGAEVEVFRNDAIDVEGVRALRPEAVVLSPGPCTPNEAGVCVPLIRALSGKLPILGVCLGHQSIGQAFGGDGAAGLAGGARQGVGGAATAAPVSSPGCPGRWRWGATTRWWWSPPPFRSAWNPPPPPPTTGS